MNNFFCIDPGLRNVGWCLCRDRSILHKGVITTEKTNIQARIEKIADLIEKNSSLSNQDREKKCFFLMEDINFIKKGREKSSIGLIMVMGAIIYKFKPMLLNPFSVRKKLLNTGRASKEQVKSFVEQFYGEEIKNHNVTDALLLHIYAIEALVPEMGLEAL